MLAARIKLAFEGEGEGIGGNCVVLLDSLLLAARIKLVFEGKGGGEGIGRNCIAFIDSVLLAARIEALTKGRSPQTLVSGETIVTRGNSTAFMDYKNWL